MFGADEPGGGTRLGLIAYRLKDGSGWILDSKVRTSRDHMARPRCLPAQLRVTADWLASRFGSRRRRRPPRRTPRARTLAAAAQPRPQPRRRPRWTLPTPPRTGRRTLRSVKNEHEAQHNGRSEFLPCRLARRGDLGFSSRYLWPRLVGPRSCGLAAERTSARR